jgi:hypothetical protein
VLAALTAEKLASLREEYPVESLVPRLAYEDDTPSDRRTVVKVSQDDLFNGNPFHNRAAETFRELHENYVRLFVQSSAFGIARMSDPTMELPWGRGERRLPLPEPPGQADVSSDTAESVPGEVTASPLPYTRLHDMHRDAIVDFIGATWSGGMRFGYFKSREYVVGFRPHQFGHYPHLEQPRLQVHRLSLVSLLKHAEPRVYVSDQLPRMDDLRNAPTRPLDRFERAGLDLLLRGEELAGAQGPDRVRLLGPIVAGKTCIGCHGVEKGTLLGAFSYDLRRGVRE